MELTPEEVKYYAIVFAIGCAGGLCRQWFDGDQPDWRRFAGSVFAGGIFSFGAVGLWLGHSANSDSGPMYFLAVAAFVGYFSLELQQYVRRTFGSIITAILKRVGIDVKQSDEESTQRND